MGLFDIFKKKPPQIPPAQEEKSEQPAALPEEKAAATEENVRDEGKDMDIAKKVLEQLQRDTLKPVLRFSLTDAPASLFASKVGGLPYLPSDTEIPTDKNGDPLQFLAQADCRELSELPDFPHSGLLQFWIGRDDGYGLFNEGGSRVIWYETIDDTVTEEAVRARLDDLPEADSPVDGEYGMAFTLQKEAVPSAVFNFSQLFTPIFNRLYPESPIESPDDLGDDINEMIWNYTENSGHKFGGYPMFTQWDPRDENDARTVLLFQLDSDYSGKETKVIWGDSGVCGFFCTPEELKERNFSNVLYNWDCC